MADAVTVTPAQMVWATKKDLQRYIAAVPNNWLYRFAAGRPNDIRKLGEADNASLLFRVSAVLQAIEDNEFVRPRNLDKQPSI